MNIILLLSLFIGLGFVFGKLAARIKLPTVSGYLIAGLLFSIVQTAFNFDVIDTNLPILNYISEKEHCHLLHLVLVVNLFLVNLKKVVKVFLLLRYLKF